MNPLQSAMGQHDYRRWDRRVIARYMEILGTDDPSHPPAPLEEWYAASATAELAAERLANLERHRLNPERPERPYRIYSRSADKQVSTSEFLTLEDAEADLALFPQIVPVQYIQKWSDEEDDWIPI